MRPNSGYSLLLTLFYQGSATNITYYDGTVASYENYAQVNYNMSGIATGEDFYEAFCVPDSDSFFTLSKRNR